MLPTKQIDFTTRYFNAVEKKHQDYFTHNNIKIFDCGIIGRQLSSVHIVKQDMPLEIKYNIETMFWQ